MTPPNHAIYFLSVDETRSQLSCEESGSVRNLWGQSHGTVTRSGFATMLQSTCSQFKLFCERAIDENRALRDENRALQEENIELKIKLKAVQAALSRHNFFIAKTPASVLPLTMKQVKIMLCIMLNLCILMTIHTRYWYLVN